MTQWTSQPHTSKHTRTSSCMSSSALELLAAAGSADAKPRFPTTAAVVAGCCARAARSRRVPALNAIIAAPSSLLLLSVPFSLPVESW